MYTISASNLRKLLKISNDDKRFKPDFSSSEAETPPQKFDTIRIDKEKVLESCLISF